MEKHPCRIVICGDIRLTHDTEVLFAAVDEKRLFKNLLPIFQKADLLIANLECPLTDADRRIIKWGSALKGPKVGIKALKSAGFGVLGLANNHIRDFGDPGVLDTIEICRRQGVLTTGAGKNVEEAAKPVVENVKGWRIGIKAFAEHEFNAAGDARGGAHVFDPYAAFDEIKQTKEDCDYLLVLYHGGIEHYKYPSPLFRKKCRKMIDCGADLVVCQHSHCVGSCEDYGSGVILYGQGNTLSGYRPGAEDWNDGLLVRVTLLPEAGKHPAMEYIPITADESGTDLMPGEKAERLLKGFNERSSKIADREFLESSWRSFCASKEAGHLPMLLGLGRVINYLNKKTKNKIVSLFFSRKRLRLALNVIRCEAHHEVLKTILENRTGGVTELKRFTR